MSEAMSDATAPAHERSRWSSRVAFYFAAVGAAVGFGNVWRFPSLSVKFGGGAFFIPYLLALVFIGIPLAILEIGFGQFFQTGDVGVFGGFHPRLRGIGLASVACGFMLDTYYAALIAWVVNAFFDSFRSSSPWDDPDVDGTMAINYFIDDVIGAGTLGPDGRPTRMVWRNVGFCALVWILIYFCIAFGIKWTGRITYFTMGFPIVLLFVFLGKAVSLEGSQAGIKQYIGIWDVSVLSEKPEVWSEAVTQIFFSIGITFGILTAYGSHCKRDEPAVMNTVVVAISNSLFSFVAGFAVFAALGHLAYKEGVEVTSLSYAGFSLVFGTWPVVFNDFNNGIHWVRLLFFTLFLLGIDSAFAFQEAIISVLRDTVYLQHTPRWKIALGLCTTGYCFSLIYCTDAGLNFLDVIDYYINFVMILVGFFEAFGSAWAYGMEDQIKNCGKPAVISFMIANFGAVGFASGLWFGLKDNAIWAGVVGGILFYLAGLGVTSHFLAQKLAEDTEQKWSMASLFWEIYLGNILALRARIQPVIGHVPFVWCILMKHFIPHILIVLFVNLAGSDNGAGEPNFGGYGSYVTYPFQVLGILTFVFTLFLFSVGMVKPEVYAPLALPQIKDLDGEESSVEQVQDKNVADAENTAGDDKLNEGDDKLKISDQESEEEAC